MRNKYVLVSENINVIEEEFTLAEPNSMICKPLFIYLGFLEKKLFSNTYFPKKPVIPGSSGVAKVIEDPSGRRGDLSGKLVIVKPFSRHGLIGLERNGLLTHFASIPPENIWGFINQPKPFHAIIPYVSHAINLVELGEDPSIVLGCNIIGIAVALVLKKTGREEPVIVCENPPRSVKRLGLEIYESISATSKSYSTVYVADGDFPFIHDSLHELNYRNVIISSYVMLKYLPLKREFEAKIISTFDDKSFNYSLVSSISTTLMKALSYVEINDISESILLLPPRDLGVIVNVKRVREDSSSGFSNKHI
ncbi:MAG: hypothetical protein QXZ39_03310 [Desulfurococcaceae archaeon]